MAFHRIFGVLMFAEGLRSTGRHWLSRTLLALLFSGFLLAYGLQHVEDADAARGLPSFTWHLPGTYVGDPPVNGLVPEMRPSAIEANRWLLDTVISPAWCENSGLYLWSTKSGEIPNLRTSRCRYTLEFPSSGNYSVTLTAELGGERAQDTQQVSVDGRLIVSIGDSIASGEGVPDIRHTLIGGDWQNEQCHRSARAAPALAAQIIQRREPSVPITFIHLACSGATILKGLVGSYAGIAPRGKPELEPQVDVLNSIESRRKIDAVLISIGANDVYFGKVVQLCIPRLRLSRPRSCFLREATLGGKRYATLEEGISEAVSKLKARYALLHAAISEIPSSAIYLLQYYDPTRAADGSTCGSILRVPHTSLDEARKQVLEPLNRIGKEVADLYGWHYIAGISHLFDHHGFCVKGRERWVVKPTNSLLDERSLKGTLHPNAEGHRQIAALLANALLPALFPASPQPGPTNPTPAGTVQTVLRHAGSVNLPFAVNIPTEALTIFGVAVLLLIFGLLAQLFTSESTYESLSTASRWSAAVSLLAVGVAFADLAIKRPEPAATSVVFALGSVVAAIAGPVLWLRASNRRAQVTRVPPTATDIAQKSSSNKEDGVDESPGTD